MEEKMSIEDTVYKLRQKYLEPSYGVKSRIDVNPDDELPLIQNDLILLRKDNGEELDMDEWVVKTKEDYIKRLKSERQSAKIDLLNEILEDNPDKCCITGCNIK